MLRFADVIVQHTYQRHYHVWAERPLAWLAQLAQYPGHEVLNLIAAQKQWQHVLSTLKH